MLSIDKYGLDIDSDDAFLTIVYLPPDVYELEYVTDGPGWEIPGISSFAS